MSCTPGKIFKTSALREKVRYRDGDTQDIIRVIMDMDAVADQYVNKEAAQCLIGEDDYETLYNVFHFVKQNVKYKADTRGREVVKSPAALFSIGKGDCKSFSIAEAALLRALGFKGIRYRFTAYGSGRDVTHVYVVCKLHGKDVILDAVHSKFDDEVPYSYKKDIPASRSSISGIGRLPGTVARNPITTFIALGLIAWGITRY